MNNLQALTIIWNALHDHRHDSLTGCEEPEGDEANDDAWSDITHAMAILHESLDIRQEDID
jgi:hypothetical protein